MSADQQAMYTIHESQLAADNGQQLLIDTSTIPLAQQGQLPPLPAQHAHLQPEPPQSQSQSQSVGEPHTSQPGHTSRVAPEHQSLVYNVHPAFEALEPLDALLIRQRAQAAATCCGLESTNSYTVRDNQGRAVLAALERKYLFAVMSASCRAAARQPFH